VFTMMAGTGHVAYSVLPVIAEVSRKSGIRPARPLGMAVIASQFAIVASPIAAAVVACVAFLEPQGITLADVLSVTIPSTFIGLALACVIVNKLGKELKDDPEYQRRLQDPDFRREMEADLAVEDIEVTPEAKKSVGLFLFGALAVVIMGAFPTLRPAFDGEPMGMAHTIEIVMLSVGALIILTCKPDGNAISQGSVFHAGMRAIVAIFGIAWLGDTLIGGHGEMVKEAVSGLVEMAPWTFAFALFALSVMVNSQGATTAVLVPVAITLGLPPSMIIATFVAVNGYFFIPNYGPIIASIDFDRTGTTRIGKYIFNHSFMAPGLLSMVFSIACGLLITQVL
ncbi:anaerobic C4-dicarboxylate transporter family protein, partial [Salinivibrio sp. IB282]